MDTSDEAGTRPRMSFASDALAERAPVGLIPRRTPAPRPRRRGVSRATRRFRASRQPAYRVTSTSDNLRATADDLHLRLARTAARWDKSHKREETDFTSSDLDRLVGAAQQVSREVGDFATKVAQMVDEARSALRTPLHGTHQEKVTRLHATSDALERAFTALNKLQFGPR